MASAAGDTVHGANPASNNHGDAPETSNETSVNPPNMAHTHHPVIAVNTSHPPVQSDTAGTDTVTEPYTAEEESALKAWALRKGYAMGMDDTDDLGDVSDYVGAGALAFGDTVQMRNLLQKDPVRSLQLRRAITVNRQQNAQACVAYLCGVVQRKPCGPCSRGSGPFTECVTVEGCLLGACASCHYGGEGNRCTFHISSKSFVYTRYNRYAAANVRKEAVKETGSRHAIIVDDSDNEGQPPDSPLPKPRKRKSHFRYPK